MSNGLTFTQVRVLIFLSIFLTCTLTPFPNNEGCTRDSFPSPLPLWMMLTLRVDVVGIGVSGMWLSLLLLLLLPVLRKSSNSPNVSLERPKRSAKWTFSYERARELKQALPPANLRVLFYMIREFKETAGSNVNMVYDLGAQFGMHSLPIGQTGKGIAVQERDEMSSSMRAFLWERRGWEWVFPCGSLYECVCVRVHVLFRWPDCETRISLHVKQLCESVCLRLGNHVQYLCFAGSVLLYPPTHASPEQQMDSRPSLVIASLVSYYNEVFLAT